MRCTVSTFLRLGAVARMHGESAPVCGIAGVIALSDRGPDPSVVEHMTRRLDDRSSHAWGYYVDGGVGLGIAGPAVAASQGPDQPATNEEQSVRVVLAGRISNAPPVRDALLRAGLRFRTYSDAEVVAHAWEHYGERALDLFTGIFAIAVWDERRHRLFLAVDRVGETRLHYAITSAWLIFASEVDAAVVHPALNSERDLATVRRSLSFDVDRQAPLETPLTNFGR